MLVYPTETQSKPMDLYIKENYKEEITGLEIGAWDGTHAKNLLTILPNLKKLYVVDPFVSYKDTGVSRSKRKLEWAYHEFKTNLLKTDLSNRIEFIHKRSSEAINDIPNGLDFAYIDGNHTYLFVKKDIEFYYPKVRKGGIIGGDDYNNPRHGGVMLAVDEFVKENGMELHLRKYKVFTAHKSPTGWVMNYDWWVIKDE